MQKITWQEISGACGDLGTFLPLTVALVHAVGLDLGTTLIWTGLYNIAVGLLFDVPLPVQPMKAICAIAIASPGVFDLHHVLAAGLVVGTCILLLGAANLISLLHHVPQPVIAGMQLALGLEITRKGLLMVWGGSAVWPPPHLGSLEGPLVGIAACVFILLSVYAGYTAAERGRGGRGTGGQGGGAQQVLGCEDAWSTGYGQHGGEPAVLPAALIVVVVGVVLTCVCHPSVLRSLSLGPSTPVVRFPSWSTLTHRFPSWSTLAHAAMEGGLPQLPLTALNSIVAVAAWAADAFPNRPVSTRRLSLVLGAFNIVGALLGSLPSCNGVGGLAAQAAFGAQSGTAPVLLGMVKVVLGLVFGSSLLQLLQHFPETLLGALLVFAGVQLAAFARSASAGPRWDMLLMLLTAALCTAFQNVFVGVAGGTLVGVVVQLPGWTVEAYRTRGIGERVEGQYRRLEEAVREVVH